MKKFKDILLNLKKGTWIEIYNNNNNNNNNKLIYIGYPDYVGWMCRESLEMVYLRTNPDFERNLLKIYLEEKIDGN